MTNILDVIEKYWLTEDRRERNAHYPSDALDCRRELFWRWTGEPESNPIDATGFWRMNIGASIHDMIQRTLEKIAADPEVAKRVAWEGLAVESEVRSGSVAIDGSQQFAGRQLDRPVRYRVDMIIMDSDGQKSGVEIKTKYGAGVRAMKDEGLDARMLVQAAMYIVLGGIRRYYFPIVSRDDGDRVQFLLQMVGDPPDAKFEVLRIMPGSGNAEVMKRYGFELFTKAIDRLKDVERHLENNDLPPRDYLVAIKNGEIKKDFQHEKVKYKSDWQCLYCPFMNRCWGEVVESYQDGNNAEMFRDNNSDAAATAQQAAALSLATKTAEKPSADPDDKREEL